MTGNRIDNLFLL